MQYNTINDIVNNSLTSYSDRTAFEMWQGEKVTYAEAALRIKEVQEKLLNAGIKAGDKVALLSSNMPNWGICYFATIMAGYVVVPILPDFTPEELEMLLTHSETKALMVSDKLFTKISKPTIERLNIVIRTKNLSIISQSVNTEGTTASPRSEDMAAIIYTSGTTSNPKGVMLSHKSICSQIEMMPTMYPIHNEDVFLSVLPLSHVYECTLGMIYPFSVGGKVVYLDKAPTASVLKPALKATQPTLMLIVPLIIEKIFRAQVQAKFSSTAFWRLLYRIGFMRRYLHRMAGKRLMKFFGGHIRFLGIGGAKLDGAAEQFLFEAKMPYDIGYGMTETAPLLAGAVDDQVCVGSTGFPLRDVQIRLDNINPDTGLGEIVVKTPSVMMGYYKNPEATAQAFTADGWFRTGDLGCFDKAGKLYIRGRLKNMIVGPSGENIYPEDIETVLNRHVCISESVVTEKEGHLVALVHFDTEALENKYNEWRESWEHTRQEWEQRKEELKKEIIDYVNSKVNRFSKISEVVEQKEEFKKTPTHKIKRFIYNRK